MTDFWVRPALPGDAAQLVSLAEAVGSEPEAWLISDSRWRSVSDERRYLRAARRHPDAAIFVAEAPEGIVGRLSVSPRPAPGEPPRRRSRADGGSRRPVGAASAGPCSNRR